MFILACLWLKIAHKLQICTYKIIGHEKWWLAIKIFIFITLLYDIRSTNNNNKSRK